MLLSSLLFSSIRLQVKVLFLYLLLFSISDGETKWIEMVPQRKLLMSKDAHIMERYKRHWDDKTFELSV